MSIDRDTFKNTSEDEPMDLSVPDQVLGYLAVNEDRAFKAREIASQIGADEGAVSTALSRLKDRDLVEHKATYWAITDDAERLDGYSGYERATALFNNQLGTEDKEAWREYAPGTTPECRGRAVTDEETPIFERGDVVYGDDPFKGEEDARPWLILSNHEGHPFHGDQYIALTLTSKSWMDGLIEAPEESWVRGGTPDKSRIVPWAVQSIDQEDIDFWQGRLDRDFVDQAVAALVKELQ